jgi:hypothetical protein
MVGTTLTHALADDGSYDFVHEGAVVGRLEWAAEICDARPWRGWWLAVPGEPDELICRVPDDLFGDLPAARARGVSMSLGLAQHMLADRVEGLLDAAAASGP